MPGGSLPSTPLHTLGIQPCQTTCGSWKLSPSPPVFLLNVLPPFLCQAAACFPISCRPRGPPGWSVPLAFEPAGDPAERSWLHQYLPIEQRPSLHVLPPADSHCVQEWDTRTRDVGSRHTAPQSHCLTGCSAPSTGWRAGMATRVPSRTSPVPKCRGI